MAWTATETRTRTSETRRSEERGEAYTTALLALAITAIVVATAAPNFSAMYDTYSMYGAARRVVGDLRKTRISAATENNRYAITLVDPHTYTIHDDDNGDGTVDAGEDVTTIDLSSGWPAITLSFSNALEFRANASTAGAETIVLAGGNGDTRTISVSAAGRVRIEAVVLDGQP